MTDMLSSHWHFIHFVKSLLDDVISATQYESAGHEQCTF